MLVVSYVSSYVSYVLSGAQIHVQLIGSKTRVAPTKMLSISLLELKGFVLGTRWTRTIINSLSIIKMNYVFQWKKKCHINSQT